MTDISEKLFEVKIDIQEGEKMLVLLRKLPESEETNAQIKRFQDLVGQLEECKKIYEALQVCHLHDFETQLNALCDKHERIKVLLSHSVLEEPVSISATSDLNPSLELQRSTSAAHSNHRPLSNKSTNINTSQELESNDSDYYIKPSEWLLHYESQIRQLSSLLSEIARFQEMVGRLSNLVIGLDMTEAVNLLSDVGQRFTGVHLRLLSLQRAYETVYNIENPSDNFKADQLKDLLGFLISLGRSLEVTKGCFFTVVSIIKRTLRDQNAYDTRDDDSKEPELSTPNPESVSVSADATITRAQSDEANSDFLNEQRPVALESTQLCNRWEEHSREKPTLSSSRDNCGSTSVPISGVPSSSADRPDRTRILTSLPKADASTDSFIPTLKRLQARKKHVEELKSELRSFSFFNENEARPHTITNDVNTHHASLPSSAALVSNVATKGPVQCSRTSPRVTVTSGFAMSDLNGVDTPRHTSFSAPVSSTSKRVVSVVSDDGDAAIPNCEVVAFQEPEVICLNNTEGLCKNIGEVRIWHEEQRQASADSISSHKKDVKTSTNSRPHNGGLSESTSCMDTTALATWGGDSDREDNDIEDDMIEGGEYIEDVPSIVSTRSSRAGRQFNIPSALSVNDGDSAYSRDCLGVRIDRHESGVGLSLPHLGHSPSPCTERSRPVTMTRIAQHQQSSRSYRPNLSELAEVSFEEHVFTKPLAAKIANLEFKVEQLSQTCQLLFTENARLNSNLSLLLASQRLSPVANVATTDWPVSSHSGTLFANAQQPLLSIPTGGLFPSPVLSFRPPESASGLSSIQSLVTAPPTPTMHALPSSSLEKVLDQVQILTAQVIEQHSRMNQLQSDLHAALQRNRHLAGGGDSQHLVSTSGTQSYPQLSSSQSQAQIAGFPSLMALQTHQSSSKRTPNKLV